MSVMFTPVKIGAMEVANRFVHSATYEAIGTFSQGARRVAEANADAVQIHAAHGYLISEFFSPFFNRRKDAWGGSGVTPKVAKRYAGWLRDAGIDN